MNFFYVVVVYNNERHLPRLLQSLSTWTRFPAELLIWDNGKHKEALEKFSKDNASGSLKITVLESPENIGFGAAINRCIEDIQKRYPQQNTPFIIINPDAELASEVKIETIQELQSKKGLVGLRVFNDLEKKSRQASARSFPSLGTAICGREGLLTKIFPKNPWSQKYLGQDLDKQSDEQRVDWVSGCAFFSDSETWQKLGGYDESYFLYVEDVDLGRTAQRRGIPVFYSPHIDVVHFIRGSTEKRLWKSDYYHHLGMWIYYNKWAGPLAFILGPFVFIGIWLRFLLRRLVGP